MTALPLLFLVSIAVLGLAAGLAVLLSRGLDDDAVDGGGGALRLAAELQLDPERTADGLTDYLALPSAADDVTLGRFFVEMPAPGRLVFRTRAEAGRGFLAEAILHRHRRGTRLEYSIVRLPSNEVLHRSVLGLELQIVKGLRSIDPQVSLQLSSSALLDLDSARITSDGVHDA